MSARDELKKLRDNAIVHKKEAEDLVGIYDRSSRALNILLEKCSDAQLEKALDDIKKECPGVLPS